MSPLHYACRNGNFPLVKYLISKAKCRLCMQGCREECIVDWHDAILSNGGISPVQFAKKQRPGVPKDEAGALATYLYLQEKGVKGVDGANDDHMPYDA